MVGLLNLRGVCVGRDTKYSIIIRFLSLGRRAGRMIYLKTQSNSYSKFKVGCSGYPETKSNLAKYEDYSDEQISNAISAKPRTRHTHILHFNKSETRCRATLELSEEQI